jgi:hypothetical protein
MARVFYRVLPAPEPYRAAHSLLEFANGTNTPDNRPYIDANNTTDGYHAFSATAAIKRATSAFAARDRQPCHPSSSRVTGWNAK